MRRERREQVEPSLSNGGGNENKNPLQIIPVWRSKQFRGKPVVPPQFQSILQQILQLKPQNIELKCEIDQRDHEIEQKYDEFVAKILCPAILKLPAINKPESDNVLMEKMTKEYTPEFPHEGSRLREQVLILEFLFFIQSC